MCDRDEITSRAISALTTAARPVHQPPTPLCLYPYLYRILSHFHRICSLDVIIGYLSPSSIIVPRLRMCLRCLVRLRLMRSHFFPFSLSLSSTQVRYIWVPSNNEDQGLRSPVDVCMCAVLTIKRSRLGHTCWSLVGSLEVIRFPHATHCDELFKISH